jgi:uncharacterized HAD superfamily protein
MKNPRPVILSLEEMVASTLTASCLHSREETMKKFVKKKKKKKKLREAAKRTFNKVSELRHQSSIEILGSHSRLETVRFAAVALQIQLQYRQPIGSSVTRLCHDAVNHLPIVLHSTASKRRTVSL